MADRYVVGTLTLQRAGRVYPQEREQAIRRQQDVQYVIQLGKAAGINVARKARAAVTQAYTNGSNVQQAAARSLREFEDLLIQAMVFAKLKGMERAAKDLGRTQATIAASKSPAYTRGIRFLQRRLVLPEGEIAAVEALASGHVVRVLSTATTEVQRQLQRTMLEIQADNLHVRAGVKKLRAQWSNLGLDERNSFQIEAIFRTQTQLAFAAGNAEIMQEPEVDDILWGYKYVTAGDDRVRDSHIALDGVTLPKDDPWWQTNTPPNGWSCRCQVIPQFDKRKKAQPPDSVKVDGKTIEQGADKGFKFNPGSLLKTGLSASSPVPVAKTIPYGRRRVGRRRRR